jgi:hypothetical protein
MTAQRGSKFHDILLQSGERGRYVTVTEPSALVTTRGLPALAGQYTLHSCGGARKIALSMNGRSSALHTLQLYVKLEKVNNIMVGQGMGSHGGCTNALRRRRAAMR